MYEDKWRKTAKGRVQGNLKGKYKVNLTIFKLLLVITELRINNKSTVLQKSDKSEISGNFSKNHKF